MLGKNSLKDLVGASPTAVAEPDPVDTGADRRVLVTGSPLARALYEVLSGTPSIVVDSPPGAGKTTLVVDLVTHLVERTDLTIGIACPTSRGAVDVAYRVAAALDGDQDNQVVRIQSKWHDHSMEEFGISAEKFTSTAPVVFTVASGGYKERTVDLLIFDEAYQTTFADFAKVADDADQVLMVGDPGQIGPVVTVDTSMLATAIAPDTRCPEVMQTREYNVTIPMDKTYRLGQDTVDVIAPLYDFPFTSGRPDRHLITQDGALPEIRTVQVDSSAGRDAFTAMEAVVDQVQSLIGSTVVQGQETRVLEPKDVAVVVSHNVQLTAIGAVLRTRGITGVSVGTADSMQGGQWHAVVALDPVFGYDLASPHSLAAGRLCVMLSRHMTHLTWVHDGVWEDALTDPVLDAREARLGLKVRRHLMRY